MQFQHLQSLISLFWFDLFIRLLTQHRQESLMVGLMSCHSVPGNKPRPHTNKKGALSLSHIPDLSPIVSGTPITLETLHHALGCPFILIYIFSLPRSLIHYNHQTALLLNSYVTMRTLQKCNHAVCIAARLAFYIQHNSLGVHPSCAFQQFIPFFVIELRSPWFNCSPLKGYLDSIQFFIMNKVDMNIHI